MATVMSWNTAQTRVASLGSVLIAVLLLSAGDVERNPGPESFSTRSDPLERSIKVGCFNCCSAARKTALLHDLIDDENLDLLLLSETWHTSDTPTAVLNDIAPSGYAALNVPRPLVAGGPTRGGGVAAVYRESLVVRRHPLADDFNPVTFELQLLRVGPPPSSHVVVNIYRPQWMSTVSAFVNELADVIAALAAGSSTNIIVCGDLNCPGVDVMLPDDKLTDVFDSFGMSQLVRSPTRDENVLDVLASSNPTAVFE